MGWARQVSPAYGAVWAGSTRLGVQRAACRNKRRRLRGHRCLILARKRRKAACFRNVAGVRISTPCSRARIGDRGQRSGSLDRRSRCSGCSPASGATGATRGATCWRGGFRLVGSIEGRLKTARRSLRNLRTQNRRGPPKRPVRETISASAAHQPAQHHACMAGEFGVWPAT